MTRVSSRHVSTDLAEYKDAVRGLSRLYERIGALVSAQARSPGSDIPSDREMTEENVGNKVQCFSHALVRFLKLRKKMQTELKVFENSLHDLEKAESADEISTLMGLTLLSDQRDYRNAMIQIAECYEDELSPTFPEIMGIVKFAAQSRESGRWTATLFNYDARTGEDDITKMIIALRDHDIKRFNKIYDAVNRKMDVEEQRLHESP